MIRQPPRYTRTATLIPSTTLFRSLPTRVEVDRPGFRLAGGKSACRRLDTVLCSIAYEMRQGLAHPCAELAIEQGLAPGRLEIHPFAGCRRQFCDKSEIGSASCRERVCQYV